MSSKTSTQNIARKKTRGWKQTRKGCELQSRTPGRVFLVSFLSLCPLNSLFVCCQVGCKSSLVSRHTAGGPCIGAWLCSFLCRLYLLSGKMSWFYCMGIDTLVSFSIPVPSLFVCCLFAFCLICVPCTSRKF